MTRTLVLIATIGLFAAACGSSSTTDEPAESEVTEVTEPPATDPPVTSPATEPAPPTTAEQGPSAAASLEDVKASVVQIVATGTFADPAGGVQANVPGSGSGFVIDPSGIAVTNNHVVTGAALLEVYLADEDAPRNARVLGVSECSDLAVIQIDGADFPYLDWYGGEVTAGMEIFAAGFPLGDAEYTVLDGVVSKESASGETSWASVDSVIEHSADTLPGNSGGPIVTPDGVVVAVNYAGNEAGQSFAIGLDEARPVVEELATGVDVDSIGINGEAFVDESFSGIYVYSVESGSPADAAGVEPGDLLLSLESIVLATDGTMSDYCDVLRSHLPTDTLDIEVYRPATEEVLEGQLNGSALAVVTSFATAVDEEVVADGGATYSEYTTITDESGLIEVSVPVEWADVNGASWTSSLATGTDELIGPALSASPDRDAYATTWTTPGVFIGASTMIPLGIEGTLDSYDFASDCVYDGRFPYDDGSYTGLYDLYTNCGEQGTALFQIAAEPPDQTWLASVQIQVVTDADLEAADTIISTFTVGDLAG